jgi:MSHA pilin protein MshD
MAIMIISVSVAGVLMVFGNTARNSADPMVRKQAVAIAESLLNEVMAQPFTFCDPQDPANDAATPPASTAACTGGVAGSQDGGNGGALGPQPASENRFNNADPLDNVSDYNGYAMPAGIFALDDGGTVVPGLGTYAATVTVSRAGAGFGLADDAVLRIVVQVSRQGDSVSLTGYRFRYAPHTAG